MADEIQAPWTPEQIDAINSYQTIADHPLICSRTRDLHKGSRVALIARRDGMHCSDPSCGYRQNWVLDYMADPNRASWGPGWERLLERARDGNEPARYAAARAAAARSLHAVESSAAEAGLDVVAGVAGWRAELLERPSPFAALASELRQSWGPKRRLSSSDPGGCYEASFGWVHVKPSCRCSKGAT